MAGKDDEMFMKRGFNVMPKTTEQHLNARSDKSVAYVTNNKRRCSTFSTTVLKLTADRQEASRGLFATAELLVTRTDDVKLLHPIYPSIRRSVRPSIHPSIC